MLLTLKPAQQPGYADPYAYSPAQRSPSSYYATPPKSASLPPLPESQAQRMSTPHRGLPPPSVMERSLPLPENRAPPSNSLSLGSLPQAPAQWQGQDESMRSWLLAKSEEDRRKQEEEKTRQEGYKLEQRRIEQNMLQESLRGGIPPPMVPLVFASIGGANTANMSVEWAQHYMAQISLQQQAQAQIQQQQQVQQQQQQQQQQQPQQQQQLPTAPQAQQSPEQRRETRLITGPNPNPYGAQQMQPPAQTAAAQPIQQTQPNSSYTPSYQSAALPADRIRQPPLQAAPATSASRPPTSQSSLSRLNTGELHAPIQGTASLQISGSHLQNSQSSQQEQPSSPLYFHHWQPPDAGGKPKDKDQGTPSGRSTHTSPNIPPPGSHLRSEYTTSPKKRKATGSHQAAPTPSSHTSPSFSGQGSSESNSGTRRRQRAQSHISDTSSVHSNNNNGNSRTPGANRQTFSDVESGRSSAHPETRHQHAFHQRGELPDGREMREIRHGSKDLSERSSPKREQ
ncbi:CCR4-NOT transcription complex, subunit 3 [Puttea exsequens]|nr:CCR4-NOT transcription complex, subunit 3 [Puttea exsequens]